MLGKKKKGMIDIRELHRKGKIKIPKSDGGLEPNSEGFVELDSSGEIRQPKLSGIGLSASKKSLVVSSGTSGNEMASSLVDNAQTSSTDSEGFFNFFNSDSSSTSPKSFSTETEGYSKREVDTKIESLDNKIYRLEQRIELLERKAGVGDGW